MYSTEIILLSRCRKDILDGAGAILAKAKQENRSLTDTERQQFERRHAKGKVLLTDIERLQSQSADEEQQRQLLSDGRKASSKPPGENPERDKKRHACPEADTPR